jgi:hypothetical protein
MKSTRLALAGGLLFVAACASPAGVWTGSYDDLDRTALRQEIEKTLRADQWRIVQKGDVLAAEKRDGGGHSTRAYFTFAAVGSGSSFDLNGKSSHVVNWLSCGILGAMTKSKAAHTCANFVETFDREHLRPK